MLGVILIHAYNLQLVLKTVSYFNINVKKHVYTQFEVYAEINADTFNNKFQVVLLPTFILMKVNMIKG